MLSYPLDPLVMERLRTTRRVHGIPDEPLILPPIDPPRRVTGCKGCGVSFEKQVGWQKYCSPQCRDDTDNRRHRERRRATCRNH